jgi:hypothetical protein
MTWERLSAKDGRQCAMTSEGLPAKGWKAVRRRDGNRQFGIGTRFF